MIMTFFSNLNYVFWDRTGLGLTAFVTMRFFSRRDTSKQNDIDRLLFIWGFWKIRFGYS